MERWNVGVLIFDGVAVLDVAGPFEVLTRARLEPGVESRRTEDDALFDVFTVAKITDTVTATGGMAIVPRHSFADAPRIDLLLVPGGFGTRALLQDPERGSLLPDADAQHRLPRPPPPTGTRGRASTWGTALRSEAALPRAGALLGALVAVSLAPSARAQDTQYWAIQYGPVGQLVGG